MLPNARIIDARREPMACCFSNLKQLFANGQEFTYSVEDIARYYRTYLELMRHWDEVLPGRVLRVYHEDVVADLESSVRGMLDYCGLDFEPNCIDFHKTQRSVRTPSSGASPATHLPRWLSTNGRNMSRGSGHSKRKPGRCAGSLSGAAMIVEELFSIYRGRGADAYFGEAVTVTEHSLQAAHFAQQSDASQNLIIAALLHDIGHLIPSPGAGRYR